ncbi:MAG: hypothetical protein COV71_06045 [Candidatus Omnitrophica bacterium CG11_big_fil_rev_8_21_14_0_20_41_12]|nr:MAG: hypothetical protein COV71_06045 [Candidatus Omnitrophica bacterium CG11_big_fil_rev_8_21_14_0_20_41_12]
MKKIKIILFIISLFFLPAQSLRAENVTILYTGQTHAMLYPCSCPIRQDGGVARRATLIKQLRKKDPQLLLLDCGNFSAGGLMDEYTQSTQLDMQRSEINFKSMELMHYDAVGIGSDEFNFGKDFFLKNAKKTGPAYLSANLGADKVSAYIIKDSQGVKVGIIGLTDLEAQQKTEGLKISEPKKIDELIKSLKKENVQIIVLLSTLGEQKDLKLISEVNGIDVLFTGQNPLKEDSLTKVDNTFLLRPFWQGRKLGKLTLEVKDGKLIDCKIEELPLSDEIPDDAVISAILPRCYTDSNCRKDGSVGSCQNPGTLKSRCSFKALNKVDLLIITAKDCAVCDEQPVIDSLKKKFPGLAIKYLYYPDQKAKSRIAKLSLPGLPAYIFGKEIEKEEKFSAMKNDFLQVADAYVLKPQIGGLAYFPERKIKPGNLDLFLSLFDKDAAQLLAVTEEFKPGLHFLAQETNDGFSAKGGKLEVEEYLRAACIQKYYPQEFWSYLTCRARNINSSYWEDCLGGVDQDKLKSCARGQEGINLLRENISLSNELKIMFGPAYLLDNREIFSSRGVPQKEELKKILKR